MTAPVLYTIGFAQKEARQFFELLRGAGVTKVIDIRLKNVSQLAGFAKRADLEYFLTVILGCAYEHRPHWAPTEDILEGFKKKRLDWAEYERRFQALLAKRLDGKDLCVGELDHVCLLCSEPTPDQCHRRLVAEYLKNRLPELSILHL